MINRELNHAPRKMSLGVLRFVNGCPYSNDTGRGKQHRQKS